MDLILTNHSRNTLILVLGYDLLQILTNDPQVVYFLLSN